jgi:predicted glutamine amidotransferase
MLAIVPKPNNVVDFGILREFRKLASCGMVPPGSAEGHGDGWGIVVWKEGLPIYLGRQPKDAFDDPHFEKACVEGEKLKVNSPLMAHLRKASVGLKTAQNTHPFTSDEWAFAHNGTIRKLNLKYTTDSEWFFKCLMKDFADSGNIIDSIARQVEAVRQSFRYTSITFLLSNGKRTYAYRDCSRNENYYTLYYAETPSSFFVAQEKFFQSNWKELGNGKLLILEPESQPRLLEIAEPIAVQNSSKQRAKP